MGTLHIFSARVDPRILSECQKHFPESQEFAAYLADAVARLGGSLELTQILCSTLSERFPSKPTVSAESVRRLSVETDLAAIGRIFHSYRAELKNASVCGMTFLTRLKGLVHGPENAASIEDLFQIPRSSIDRDNPVPFCQLFNCAYAMLAGVQIDPQKQRRASS
jgi:hypothetical protein